MSDIGNHEAGMILMLRAFLRENVQPAIDTAFDRIARGSHVLWQALPLPKVDATTPTNGHPGAVQPDGTTISLDPATGIIQLALPSPGDLLVGTVSPVTHEPVWELLPPGTSGDVLKSEGAGVVDWGDPLPAETEGDLLYGTGAGWGNRAIGSVGQVLTPMGGVPVWADVSATGSAQTTTTTESTSTSISNKVISLWNGATNDTPPSGWEDVGFDDSGWAAAVPQPDDAASHPAPTGAAWITQNASPVVPQYYEWLLRQDFTLAVAAVTACTITWNIDDTLIGISVNGTNVAGYVSTDAGEIRSTTVDPVLLNPNGPNVIAVQIQNVGADPTGSTGWAATVTLTTQSGGGVATLTGGTVPPTQLPVATTVANGVVEVDNDMSGAPVAITTASKGVADGVATLDSGGQVPLSQLGNAPTGGGGGSAGGGESLVEDGASNPPVLLTTEDGSDYLFTG